MKRILNQLLAYAPILEVILRQLYWRTPMIRRLVSRRYRRPKTLHAREAERRSTINELVESLRQLGIGPGDTLIVHAGSAVLTVTGETPRTINTALRDLIGPTGILAMPGFPIFPDEPPMEVQIGDNIILPEHRYDPFRTPLWTGMLAMDLLRTPGAIRSTFPVNPLIAIGAEAPTLFSEEWNQERPTACGLGSAWHQAVRRNAKIVMLGVDVAHSLTLNHYAEDAFDTQWPIAEWYRDRYYTIKTERDWERRLVRERHPRWALHYAERALNAAIKSNGHLREAALGSMVISVLDAQTHIAFLQARRSRAFPYYGILRKYWKTRQ